MAKKGKAKISKVKRNNQTTNKMKKQGKLRLQRHRTKVQKQKQPAQQHQVEYSSESDSASGDEWADMLDEEEQKYIMNRIATQPQLLSNVPEQDQKNKSRKRKREDKGKMPKPAKLASSDSGAETESDTHQDSDEESDVEDSGSELEDKYEKELAERPVKKLRPLLPIKTKEGVMERTEEVEDTESEAEDEPPAKQPKQSPDSNGSDSDSGMEGTAESTQDGDAEVVTAVQLLAARRDKLQHDKLRIGALCSSLLEQPEKKLKNLYPILYLMEERLKDGQLNLPSVRKLASISACEVFRDILPDYMIRHQDYSNVKLKKDTLALYKYEKELLEFYKRYLQRLEKAATVLRRKKGDTRKLDESTSSIAHISLRCMCDLLVSKPNFNYATNIAQSVIPYLDCETSASEIVTDACGKVFVEDTKGDITLAIVRLINQLVKRRGDRLKPSALDCLLSLKISDIDMDEQAEIQHKKRQEEKKKKRIVNLSKKEKKRMKKLKEVERELIETEAQESELARRKQLTEVTKTVFHIYFRLLKSAPKSNLLDAALQGITKFTHVINLEYYSDLVAILSGLLRDERVRARSRVSCARAALAVLAGAGEALSVDPANFHAYLFANALDVHAGATHEDAKLTIEAISQICSRARRVSANVLRAFAKRLAELAAQLQPNGALACLLLLQHLIQQSKPVSSLLEPDPESGSGRYCPLVASPEHCGADRASLYELTALRRHHHPAVRTVAIALYSGSLPQEFTKMTPMKAFDQYDGSQMAFKPAVPPPKKIEGKTKVKKSQSHSWAQTELKILCEKVESDVDLNLPKVISKCVR
ncbi:nucleolar complex protein 3 homolog [Amyelois transitella]|uniref:nucleolar complex protein 3 homolog n=1 Tax=Amyelois transitella TaxID=680683 RepID=UPI00298FCBB6|nr:nucleolar complex protein 3 homolog [Amyelois transitella]